MDGNQGEFAFAFMLFVLAFIITEPLLPFTDKLMHTTLTFCLPAAAQLPRNNLSSDCSDGCTCMVSNSCLIRLATSGPPHMIVMYVHAGTA